MNYNKKYSIFTDFNTKDVRIFDEQKQEYLTVVFDTEEQAIAYLESQGERRK